MSLLILLPKRGLMFNSVRKISPSFYAVSPIFKKREVPSQNLKPSAAVAGFQITNHNPLGHGMEHISSQGDTGGIWNAAFRKLETAETSR